MDFHIPIMGFTQRINRRTGFDKLWRKLRAVVDPDTVLFPPLPWRYNWSHVTKFMERMADNGHKSHIYVYAYSWGCGHGFVTLAKLLKTRGMFIQHAVLCDPVYHKWWRPWRAMALSPNITVSRNVLEVSWFRQTNNKPMGTDLIIEDSTKTVVNDAVYLDRNHEHMDDAPEFHELALKVAMNDEKFH